MTDIDATELQELRQLLDKEKIRRVKQLYSHFMDDGQIDALADLFTEDAVCEFGEFGNWEGRETIRTNYKGVFGGQEKFTAMHHCTNHYIDVTGPDTATGRCYLIDVMTKKQPEEQPIVWFGLYDEHYRKVEGEWLISRCALQFLWPSRITVPSFDAPYPVIK